jgi:cytochrome P450
MRARAPAGDPSVLRFLIAAREEVDSTQLRDDLLSMLVAGHETTGAATVGALRARARRRCCTHTHTHTHSWERGQRGLKWSAAGGQRSCRTHPPTRVVVVAVGVCLSCAARCPLRCCQAAR